MLYEECVYLGMRSTSLSEALNRQLKDYLHANLNVVRFFEHFESVVQAKSDKFIIRFKR
jgi:hypothetical protein